MGRADGKASSLSSAVSTCSGLSMAEDAAGAISSPRVRAGVRGSSRPQATDLRRDEATPGGFPPHGIP